MLMLTGFDQMKGVSANYLFTLRTLEKLCTWHISYKIHLRQFDEAG